MAVTTPGSRLARPRSMGVIVLTALAVVGILALAGGHGAAQEVLTNDGVVKMVKAGLPEAVIIQKIRSSQRKFDTSTDGLVKLKGAGVPDKVIEAMMAPAGTPSAAAPSAAAPAAAGEPAISHVAGGSPRRLKSVVGNMEFKVEPFSGSRQEVVLPEPKAQYRIAEKEPVFVAPNASYQWILVKLKPGKRDRNLPMGGGGGWWTYEGTTYRHGVDPKYNMKLTTEAAPNGGLRIKPAEPLASGEYGFVAGSRGQVNLVEVFDFAVE